MGRIKNVLSLARGELWLLPLAICLAAAGLGFWLVHALPLQEAGARDHWWLYGGDSDTARELLSSLVSGLMTMTSLVISITFVILTLAANQLGPRLIWDFVSDRQIQGVIGLFLGAILYELVVLRSLDQPGSTDNLPHLAITGASVLSVLSVLSLLFYIHKVSRAIVADHVLGKVGRSLCAGAKAAGDQHNEGASAADFLAPLSALLWAPKVGYVQAVAYDHLLEIATRNDLYVRLRVRAGEFVLARTLCLEVHGGQGLDGKTLRALQSAVAVGARRTPAQDLAYSMDRLIEIAVRALSPSLNDPFTAVAALDRLGAALETLARGGVGRRVLKDKDGAVRVLGRPIDPADLVEHAFRQIRQNARGQPVVLAHMAHILGKLLQAAPQPWLASAAAEQLDRIEETAEQAGLSPSDFCDVREAIDAARRSLPLVRQPASPALRE